MADPWAVVSTTPAKPPPDPWKVVSQAPAPSSPYEDEQHFRTRMDSAYGPGKWQETSGYRDPAHNRAVGGVPTSRHMQGTPDAPGAHDIVVSGQDPATAARRLPKGYKGLPEGQIGAQGPHLHVDADPWAVVDQKPADPWQVVSQAPAKPGSLQAARGALVGQGGTIDHRRTFAGDMMEETRSRTHSALQSAASDALHPTQEPLIQTGRLAMDALGVLLAPAGGIGHAATKTVQEHTPEAIPAALGVAGSMVGGSAMGEVSRVASRVLERAKPGALPAAGGDIAEMATPLPGAAEIDALRGGARAVRGALRGGEELLEGERVGGSVGGVRERPSAPPPKPQPALAAAVEKGRPKPTTEVLGDERDPVERIDNALYRSGGMGTTGKIEALQEVRAQPKEIRDPKVQEELTHAIEAKMVDPNAEIPEHLKAAEAVRQPWAERQRTAVNRINERLASKGLSEDEIAQFNEHAPDTGYVPRRVEGKAPGLDEGDTARRSPLSWKRGGLSKTTGSLKARDQIVLEDETGARTFEHRNKTNAEWKPGMQVAHPLTGKPVTVKPATIKEIEAAGARDSKGEPIRYHKNALVNTIDEALKAERVERNLDLLDEITNSMKEEGLAHHEEWFRPSDRPPREDIGANGPPEGMRTPKTEWVRQRNPKSTPDGFVDVPHIPQLKGWKFDPKVAEVLKDYFPGPQEPIDSLLSTVNRFLNASMFITPFPHIKNVATMGFIGRGWDWVPGSGRYARFAKSAKDAMKEVLTLGPRYRQFLSEGAGLQAGDDATRNFYDALMTSATKGFEQQSGAIKAAGLNPVEVVKALYNTSHKILWNVNDMVLLQRQFELEAKGMAKRDAIKEAERWVANYRIPPQVFKSRAMKQFIADGKWVNFGRYTYGKWKAIGEMAKGLASKASSPAERMDALGKVVAAGVATLFIYPAMSWIAQKVTGNKNAHVGMGGELTPVEDLTEPGKSWVGRVAGLLTPAPVVDDIAQLSSGKDKLGRDLIDPQASPKGKAVQGVEVIADQFYPTSLGLESLRPGGAESAAGRLVGVSLPQHTPGAMKGSTAKMLRGRAKSREKKDPLESMIP